VLFGNPHVIFLWLISDLFIVIPYAFPSPYPSPTRGELSGERTKVRGLFHLYFFTFVPLILTFSLREKEFSSISSPLRGEDFRHRRICLWQKGEGDYVR
jgi:hypothetical protein